MTDQFPTPTAARWTRLWDPVQALATVSVFVEQIHSIYDAFSPCIHPYIGASFTRPDDASLRILGVGINAHSEEKDWGKLGPDAYGRWFETQAFRYQRGVLRDLSALAAKVTEAPFLLAGRTFAGMNSIFLTNAVKVYLRDSEGKRADQLSDAHFVAHLGQWHDELDAMADAKALPHVIAIIGDPFWRFACASFHPSAPFKRFLVKAYRWCDGTSLHFANRITLATTNGDHELLLVRLRHPAGRSPTGSPRWLFEQPDFVALATTA